MIASDRLSQYRLPALSAEEEYQLFTQYAATKDQKIREKIIRHNIGMLYSIAAEFQPAPDMANEGLLGLLQAIERFDPNRGFKFFSYARWWVSSFMHEHILRTKRIVSLSVSRSHKKIFYNISKMKAQLESEGISPTSEAIAERLSVRTSDVVDMQHHLRREYSTEDVIGGGQGSQNKSTSVGDMLVSDEPTPEEAYESASDTQRLSQVICSFRASLSPRSAKIFDECLLAEGSYQATGTNLGISRERVRQLANGIIANFRAYCLARGVDGSMISGK